MHLEQLEGGVDGAADEAEEPAPGGDLLVLGQGRLVDDAVAGQPDHVVPKEVDGHGGLEGRKGTGGGAVERKRRGNTDWPRLRASRGSVSLAGLRVLSFWTRANSLKMRNKRRYRNDQGGTGKRGGERDG